jgi:hypothetical protein
VQAKTGLEIRSARVAGRNRLAMRETDPGCRLIIRIGWNVKVHRSFLLVPGNLRCLLLDGPATTTLGLATFVQVESCIRVAGQVPMG